MAPTFAHSSPPVPGRFAALLRRHRQAAAVTQEALAEHAGLSARGISDLERGMKTRPHLETVRRLADALALPHAERASLAPAARPVMSSPVASAAADPRRQPRIHIGMRHASAPDHPRAPPTSTSTIVRISAAG